jgi:hypothetical protein
MDDEVVHLGVRELKVVAEELATPFTVLAAENPKGLASLVRLLLTRQPMSTLVLDGDSHAFGLMMQFITKGRVDALLSTSEVR